MTKDYSILIGGEAGQGTRLAGLIIAKLFNHLGYHIYIYEDYQSLIRGGHNFSQIRAAEQGVQSRKEKIDFLLALDENTLNLHKDYLEENGVLIFNSDKIKIHPVRKEFSNGAKEEVGVPIQTIAKELGGVPIMANTALISAFAKVVGIEWEILEEVFKKEIKKATELNLKIAKSAYEIPKNLTKLGKIKKNSSLLLTGNEAAALGAVKAGLDLYFAYPMTPATSILNYLARRQEDLNIRVLQPEDEISVINMALGASFAGAKSMVGTSGGGFALMVEALSMAAQSETPILIIESQRAGPSTGMPTYNLQSDLRFVLTAGHGDFLRFVIAPGDAEQCLYYSGLGLNLAWKYQTPVILLLDKDISENTFTVNESILAQLMPEKPLLWDKKEEYKRYKITETGISPWAQPGEKNAVVKATSYEHDELGITIESEEVAKMQEKRAKKFQKMRDEAEKLEAVKVYGKMNSDKAIVAWGITKGPAKEAAENLGIRLIQPIIVEPFPEKQMKEALKGVKKLVSVEINTSGQMAEVLQSQGIKVDGKILKYTGRPFFAREIEEKLKEIL
jgi:2-oxoglutarate ferredoxin oxidoreductase subunit alpha